MLLSWTPESAYVCAGYNIFRFSSPCCPVFQKRKKKKERILGFSEVTSCVSPFTTVEVTALGLLSNHTVVIFMVVKVAEDRDNPSFTEYV